MKNYKSKILFVNIVTEFYKKIFSLTTFSIELFVKFELIWYNILNFKGELCGQLSLCGAESQD